MGVGRGRTICTSEGRPLGARRREARRPAPCPHICTRSVSAAHRDLVAGAEWVVNIAARARLRLVRLSAGILLQGTQQHRRQETRCRGTLECMRFVDERQLISCVLKQQSWQSPLRCSTHLADGVARAAAEAGGGRRRLVAQRLLPKAAAQAGCSPGLARRAAARAAAGHGSLCPSCRSTAPSEFVGGRSAAGGGQPSLSAARCAAPA